MIAKTTLTLSTRDARRFSEPERAEITQPRQARRETGREQEKAKRAD
jgi:hypothetical protein